MTSVKDMGLNSLSVSPRRVFSPASYSSLLQYFLDNGNDVSPRGIKTKELLDASLIHRQPNDRIIPDRGRKMNIAFAIAEWISYVVGIDDIEYFKQFISTYDRFSTDGEHLDGAYGKRIVYDSPKQYDGETFVYDTRYQYEGVIDELKRDPSSRRAVISIFNSEDLYGAGGKNTPCTQSLQFFIRENLLHCKVNMRSCDVVKGLTYDMFTFTMIQELIARHLELELGLYIHNAGSFHLYEEDFTLIDKLQRPRWRVKMNRMPKLDFSHLYTMKQAVEMISNTQGFFELIEDFPNEDEFNYMRNLLLVMKSYLDRNTNKEASIASFKAIDDTSLRYVLRPWLVSSGALK